MKEVLDIINGAQGYIIIGLTVLVLILMILIVITFTSLNSLENKYRKLTRGINNKNIEELVISYLDKIDAATEETELVKQLCDDTREQLKKCIQKTSVIRYKAFDDVGSDLSFSIALLDSDNSGMVLTGIYGRQESTTYAKPIDKGISRYDLSEEENKALEQAIK